jgi:hypothetical protein
MAFLNVLHRSPQLLSGWAVMKSISSAAGLCFAVIAIACLSDIAKAETWSCDQSIADKTVKQVWIVSGDRLTTPQPAP